jgi:hypothetical protein
MNTLLTRPVSSPPTVLISHPVVYIFLDPSVSTWQACRQATAICGNKSAVTPWLRTLDTNSFYTTIQASVSQWDKCLNVNGDNAEVWCVPSACYTCAMYTLKSGYSSCHICYLISGTSLYKNTAETSDKDMLAAECKMKGWRQKHIKNWTSNI